MRLQLQNSVKALVGSGYAMPISRQNGFYVTHDLSHVACLGIESARVGECVAKVKSDLFKGVLGHPSFGFTGQDLDFLTDVPWLETVWFWDVNLRSVDGIYSLKQLKHFGIHPKRPAIDFSRFPDLRKAVVEPRPGDRGLAALRDLQLLHIWHYRSKSNDFAGLEAPESLTELQINWANVTSLESLPSLPALRRLEVHRCRSLEVLGDLGSKFPQLEHLVVTACGRVRPGEGERVARDLPRLRHAYVRDRKVV